MNVKEAIEKRRTIRKFEQRAVDKGLLLDMVDCARLSAYGANLQPLKFGIIDDAKGVVSFLKTSSGQDICLTVRQRTAKSPWHISPFWGTQKSRQAHSLNVTQAQPLHQ